MTKCIGCKKDFNNHGYTSHKKACNLFKREMRERLNNIAEYGAGPSTSNIELVTESAGCPVDLGEMLLDNEQVRFFISRKLNINLIMVLRSRNLKKNQHHPRNIDNLGYPVEKQGSQNDTKIYFPHVHQ